MGNRHGNGGGGEAVVMRQQRKKRCNRTDDDGTAAKGAAGGGASAATAGAAPPPVLLWMAPRGHPETGRSGAANVLPPRALSGLALTADLLLQPLPHSLLWNVARFLASDPIQPVCTSDTPSASSTMTLVPSAEGRGSALVVRAVAPGQQHRHQPSSVRSAHRTRFSAAWPWFPDTEFLLPGTAPRFAIAVLDPPPRIWAHGLVVELGVAQRPRPGDPLLSAEFSAGASLTAALRFPSGARARSCAVVVCAVDPAGPGAGPASSWCPACSLPVVAGTPPPQPADRAAWRGWFVAIGAAGAAVPLTTARVHEQSVADPDRLVIRLRLFGLDAATSIVLLQTDAIDPAWLARAGCRGCRRR